MDPTHGEADLRTDDPRASTTAVVGIVGALAVIVIGIALQALYLWSVDRERQRKVIEPQPQEIRAVRVEQMERLGGYRWVDKQAGVVAVPIERAMELVVEDYNREGRTP